MKRRVLFLCTGNYYRSRFAEHLFNHLAQQRQLPWEADSRGLRLSSRNKGPLSPFAAEALSRWDIVLAAENRHPQAVLIEDLAEADLVVALKEAEHRPLTQSQFPDWVERFEYWHIDDVDVAPAEIALPILAEHVQALITRLATE